ncbi:hypothetical protein N9L92_04520 [Saprospiraceae bacterium]|nr:hypothetical protein [Saprospiraceae bacterium]
MNYLKILPLLLISLLIISCGDDDPLSETIVDSTWELVSVEQTDCDEPGENIEFTSVDENNCLVVDETICNYTLQFMANGVAMLQFSEDGDVEMETLTYIVNDNNNQVTISEASSLPDPIIGTIDGDEATLSFTNDGCLAVIILERA